MSEPTHDSSPISPGVVRRAGNSVLCPTCERLNPLGLEKCDRCGGDLFADCKNCGSHNPRTSTRCPKCGHRQGGVKRSRTRNLWHNPVFWAAVTTGVGILLALLLLIWLGGGRMPRI